MIDDTHEHAYDLYWHALNYRGASSDNAESCWCELEMCVVRIVGRSAENAVRLALEEVCREAGEYGGMEVVH